MIPRKSDKNRHPSIYMQNHQILEVDFHEHLGLHFSNDCTWYQHINYIKEKTWFHINIMRKLNSNWIENRLKRSILLLLDLC